MQRLCGQLGRSDCCSGSVDAPPLGHRLWPSALLRICQHQQATLHGRNQSNDMLLSPFATRK